METLSRVSNPGSRPLGINFNLADGILSNYLDANSLETMGIYEFEMKIRLSTDYPRVCKVKLLLEPAWTWVGMIP
ncbi:hypothetical protein Poly21_23050 [Allorhodopirellula heiligendammensis]|uniref:Uncharacterized protein n=1 Tax=Allorhodopirellula heiligendammensis TaxID=2714739 RepID=A0A5C6BSA0_9BACT|nr:hypothetical protein Poly21_23050 [Allorhodopirellula heiligendammensis]